MSERTVAAILMLWIGLISALVIVVLHLPVWFVGLVLIVWLVWYWRAAYR